MNVKKNHFALIQKIITDDVFFIQADNFIIVIFFYKNVII